jgi:phosphoribosylaminoimidazolecarboxamide formyltransferase/IMP cyclohydrolase
MMDGRVKTLHPAIHGALLARAGHAGDAAELARHGFAPIDLLVVNLYPFEATAARAGATPGDVLEQIDVGGPAMLRAAAKNHGRVAVVTDPEDYPVVLAALDEGGGELPEDLRRCLAWKAFLHTARYDAAIASWLGGAVDRDEGLDAALPRSFGRPLVREETLRYGENPHQAAALYREPGAPSGLARARKLQGKELSYNNWLDLDAAFQIARDLGPTGVAVVKHTTPCGAAAGGPGLLDAWLRARATDPTSAFGGIVATAGVIDRPLAEALGEVFLEVVLARDVLPDAAEVFLRRKNLRVLTLDETGWARPARELAPKPIEGALLVQEADLAPDDVRGGEVVTRRSPTASEWEALGLGWLVVRHVKSNAIVFAAPDRTLAIGGGQTSRVDAVRMAVTKATSSLAGSALASDAFFPFPDGVETAAAAGATAVVQPGGSVKDAEVVAACDRLGLAMVFTGRRHFRH